MITKSINLDLEELIMLDIPVEAKKAIIRYCFGDDMEDSIYQYAGSLALNGGDLDNHGLSPRSIKILREVNRIIN